MLRAVLAETLFALQGARNRTIRLMPAADSRLRTTEALRPMVRDWRAARRVLFVRRQTGRREPSSGRAETVELNAFVLSTNDHVQMHRIEH